MKRVFDIIASALGLALAAPLFVVLALAIKLTSAGSVFYRGVRVGRGGRPFHIVKFRTLVANAERIGGSSTPDDDPRITFVGSLLRRYKLDELPQLFNVLMGDMSLVGPRPQVPSDVTLYTSEERVLLTVRPGITDYASIRFRDEGAILRGYADPDEAYRCLIRPEKIRLGLEYVRSASFTVDIRILWLTVLAVFGFDGAVLAPEGDKSLHATAANADRRASRSDTSSHLRKERRTD